MMLTMLAAVAGALAPIAPAPVQVMVLGTYHFGNPGRDKVNCTSTTSRPRNANASWTRWPMRLRRSSRQG